MPSAALDALESSGIAYRVIRHGPVRSLAEAAIARGVEPADVVKTMVVRRGKNDYVFVLVPGDRTISWPRLRALLGVSRLSMPDATVARQVTGYEPRHDHTARISDGLAGYRGRARARPRDHSRRRRPRCGRGGARRGRAGCAQCDGGRCDSGRRRPGAPDLIYMDQRDARQLRGLAAGHTAGG